MNLIRTLCLIALAAAGIRFVSAQDLDGVATGAAADLQKALADLTAVRQQVETERLPLAQRLTSLEQKLADRKAEFAKAQRFQENQLVELNALKSQAKQRADEVKFVESLLSEYTRAFRSHLAFIEEPRYRPVLDDIEKATASADLPGPEKLAHRVSLLGKALEREKAAVGGETFEGKALDRQGRLVSGKVALVGPVAVFSGGSSDSAGLLQQELNRADPTVAGVDRAASEASHGLATTGSGNLPLDPTLGNAFKLAAMHESLYHRLAMGGPIMVPLLGLGLAAILVALFKAYQFSRIRLASEGDLQSVLQHLERGEKEGALRRARGIAGPAGDLLATAIEHVEERKEHIEEVIYEKMLGLRTRLERGIPFLALAATTGPLMGLLGTVMGMIATFKMISGVGSGDPKQLAAGISEALICTATGMAVAIPSLLSHAFLSRKAKGIIGGMEQTAVGFVNGVPESQTSSFAQ